MSSGSEPNPFAADVSRETTDTISLRRQLTAVVIGVTVGIFSALIGFGLMLAAAEYLLISYAGFDHSKPLFAQLTAGQTTLISVAAVVIVLISGGIGMRASHKATEKLKRVHLAEHKRMKLAEQAADLRRSLQDRKTKDE